MAVAISPADILERVAFRLHLPAFVSGQFVSEAQGLVMLKDACERLTALLVRAYGSQHFARSATLTTQEGVELVSLPSGLATVEAAYWLAPDSREVRLEHAYSLDDDLTPRPWTTSDARPPAYRLQGNTMVFRPVPSEVYEIRLDYQTTPTITALSDTIYGQAGWAEWLTLDLCEQISDREDKDPTRFTARKLKIEADIKDAAAQRDRGARYQAVDAYGALAPKRHDWRFR